MYISKDKDGNSFKWSKKGKNRECEVRDNKCVVRKCFVPEDCGNIDIKTQQKFIKGICKNLFENKCPEDNENKNLITYGKNGKNDKVEKVRSNARFSDKKNIEKNQFKTTEERKDNIKEDNIRKGERKEDRKEVRKGEKKIGEEGIKKDKQIKYNKKIDYEQMYGKQNRY